MARPRTIDQDDILDAAETVVVRDGAAQLTLDAVAAQAGISKASVIYDYKSKQQLIRAVIQRRVRMENERVQAATSAFGTAPDAAIHGLIAAAADGPPDDLRAVAVNLVSALAHDAESRGIIEKAYERTIASLAAGSTNPRGAILAFLALEGLKRLELHKLHPWSEAQRASILQDIGWLVEADQLSTPRHGPPDAG